MNVTQLQRRLSAAGFDPGAIDGQIGARTYAALFRFAANQNIGPVALDLGKGAAEHFPAFAIVTPLRLAHFIGQASHETCGFQFFVEKGGSAYLSRYDGRKDLGNIDPGDGARYRGRGIFQCTGRANYARYGQKCSVDLEAHPERAAEPDVSILLACHYWRDHRLNEFADADNVTGITRAINGGENGLAGRKYAVERLKRILI